MFYAKPVLLLYGDVSVMQKGTGSKITQSQLLCSLAFLGKGGGLATKVLLLSSKGHDKRNCNMFNHSRFIYLFQIYLSVHLAVTCSALLQLIFIYVYV